MTEGETNRGGREIQRRRRGDAPQQGGGTVTVGVETIHAEACLEQDFVTFQSPTL